MAYRLLKEGEIIQEGDEYLCDRSPQCWQPVEWTTIKQAHKNVVIRRPITKEWMEEQLAKEGNDE